MSTRTLTNEFAKMRGLRITPLLAVMVGGIVALTCRELVTPGFLDSAGNPAAPSWSRLLAGLAFAVPLISPVVIAVLASRQVDPEHQGAGWLFSHTAGVPAGRLCRVKFLATGVTLLTATVLESVAVLGIGSALGIAQDIPVALWFGYTTAVAVINLVLLALHLLLAARVENQLIGLGVGVLGVFVAAFADAMPSWLAHLTPWGYYAIATPVDYRGDALVAVPSGAAGIVVLAGAATLAFRGLTHRLDRREV